jgi:predicted nucleotidyltransferase
MLTKSNHMRLSSHQIATIKTTVEASWGSDVQVTLFGSRVHDERKGGDIDLFLETSRPHLMTTIRCKIQLEEQLDIPVDLIVKPCGDQSSIAIIAKTEGIVL